MENLIEIIELVDELCSEHSVPRNVKSVLDDIKNMLNDTSREQKLVINEAKDRIAEISEDQNLQTFSRTQLWNLSNLLEEISPKL